MRIEIENNRTPLNEFIESIRSRTDAIELTHSGKVVAELTPRGERAKNRKLPRAKTHARGWEIMDEARRNAKKSGLSQRKLDQMINRSIAEMRQKNASRHT